MDERDRDARGRPKSARPRDVLGRPLPRDAAPGIAAEPDPKTPEEALERGIEHFNAGRFFEAHETWEFGWHPASEPERDFWQGLIQIAVGYTHFGRGNAHGAETLLARGAARLALYDDGHMGLPVRQIAEAAEKDAEAVRREGLGASIAPPTIQRAR
jgi:uncharacterized protein